MKQEIFAAVLVFSMSGANAALRAQVGPSADEQALLAAHNEARAKHCVPPMRWSAQLAAAAQSWVNKCTHNPQYPALFEHDPQRGTAGENLAWGPSLTARQAADLWYKEIGNYNFAAPVYSSAVGHFTQLVWRATTQVGCAKAACGKIVLWSCRYSPPGNMNAQAGTGVSAATARLSLTQNVPKACH
jgi:hypothetical protein